MSVDYDAQNLAVVFGRFGRLQALCFCHQCDQVAPLADVLMVDDMIISEDSDEATVQKIEPQRFRWKLVTKFKPSCPHASENWRPIQLTWSIGVSQKCSVEMQMFNRFLNMLQPFEKASNPKFWMMNSQR